MANLMQGTCRGGVSAERRNIYIYTNNEKVPPCTFPLQNEGTCVS